MPSATLITVDQFLDMHFEEPVELVRGRVVVVPRPKLPHSRIQTRLCRHLSNWAELTQLGEVLVEVGCIVARHPDTVRGPDVAFVVNARVAPLNAEGFFEGAPDLAVEVRSPNNTLRELVAKADEYLAAGSRAVWIVDPKRQRVLVLAAGAPRLELASGDVLLGGDVLPGFALSLADLFRA